MSKTPHSRVGFKPLSAYIDRREGVTGSSKKAGREHTCLSRRRGAVWVLVTLLIGTSLGFAFAISPAMQKTQVTYIPHPVIEIHGPEELDTQASDEGWSGNGTEENPYLITGWEVSALGSSAGIYIGNTSDHFVIRKCFVHDASTACIFLFNVTNATVIGNICENSQQGIDVVSSEHVQVVGNNCTMAFDGIRVVSSTMSVLAGNNCTGNLVGLSAHSSDNITFESNNLSYNVVSGLHLNCTNRSYVMDNTCAWNQYGTYMTGCSFVYLNSTEWDDNRDGGLWIHRCYDVSAERNSARNSHNGAGLWVEDSGRCTLDGNTVERCGEGIRCTSSDDCDVRDNQCSGNYGDGIRAEGSARCNISDNDCTDNGRHGVSAGSCHEGLIERNRCTGNVGDGVRCSVGSGCEILDNSCSGNGGSGVRAEWLSSSRVSRNSLNSSSSGTGVELTYCSDVNVSDNSCNDLHTGISFDHSTDLSCIAYNNSVQDCSFGIAISFSTSLVLRDNVMVNDGIFFVEGAVPDHWTTHEIGPTNTVNGLPVLYMVSEVGVDVVGSYGQVILAACEAVEVAGLDLSNATVGIAAGFSDGILVRDCVSSDGHVGVYGWYSSMAVQNVTCDRNARSGIEMSYATGCTVLESMCVDNSEYGIRLSGMYGAASSVQMCVVSGSPVGISSENGPSGDFVGNKVSNCTSGLSLSWTESPQLHFNEISDCGYGVQIRFTSDAVMIGNEMTGCGVFIESDIISDWNTHQIDATNSVNGEPLVYLSDTSGSVVLPGAGQVVLANCSGISVVSLNLSDCTAGVLAGFSNNVSILGCSMSGNRIGVGLSHTVDSQVMSNVIGGCVEDGVRLLGSDRNTVMDNSVTGSGTGIGLYLSMVYGSSDNLVAFNNASGNMYGVLVDDSPNNIVDGNELDSNLACGIMVGASDHTHVTNNSCSRSGDMAVSIWGSDGCTVSNNSCSMNARGIYLWSSRDCNLTGNLLYGNAEYGICLDSACTGNIVWDNVFAYNNGSLESYDPLRVQACDDGDNSWNTSGMPSGTGNYWHDWTSPDLDGDEIVDLPYNVSGTAGSRDYYPDAVTSVSIEPIPEFSALAALGLLVLVVLFMVRRKRD